MASDDKIKLSQEWKQAFLKNDYESFSQKVSLYDLLFYKKDGTNHYLRVTLSNTGENYFYGYNLNHSIIALDLNYVNTSDDYYHIYKYDIDTDDNDIIQHSKKITISFALPSFDKRAKPIFLTKDNINDIIGDDATANSLSTFIKNAMPTSLLESDYFYSIQNSSGYSYAPGIKIYDFDAIQNVSYIDSFSLKSIFTIDNEILNVKMPKNTNFDFTLCAEDTQFEKKYLSEYSEYFKAYSSLAININSSFWKNLFCEYYCFENSKINLYTLSSDGSFATLTPLVEYLLKNCYILVKCPFFADYVNYEDFGQNLSKNANVIHQNLMLSSTSDFNRFDNNSDDNIDDTSSTRPYLPTTIPSIDRFASDLLEKYSLDYIINIESKKEDSNIGYLQTQTFENYDENARNSTMKKNSSTLAPLWFDPDSRSEASDYNDIPVFMPKNGNLYVDGRIISRTIDELWEAIKRLESGRDSDSLISNKDEIGYPYNDEDLYQTSSDTRMSLKKMKFISSDNKNKIGDPTYITYSDSKILTFRVEEWVNDPQKIKYNLIDEIKHLYGWDFSVEDSLITVTKALEAVGTLEEYAPSENPYSLRELESLLRGLQYNLAYLTIYLTKNFARVGQLGEIKNKDTFNESAGTLYQLHRNFKNDTDNNATQYNSYTSLSKLETSNFGTSQDDIPSKSVYLSANGTWQSVYQFMNIRIRDDEEF